MNGKANELEPKKPIYTKDEFRALNERSAHEMSADADLQRDALDVLARADRYRWIHQATWLGEPLLNLPQDMFAVQDIIWRTRPEFIIEIGVAWGGALLFEAMLLDVVGGKKVIGVDIFMPPDLRERLRSHGRLSDRIELIEGSSTSPETVEAVRQMLNGSSKVMVILDSHHTHAHVAAELQLYAPFVAQGQYIVCCDTIVEYLPAEERRPRPWGAGNSPATALTAFLAETDRFEVDKKIDERLLFSCNPGGYLRAVK